VTFPVTGVGVTLSGLADGAVWIAVSHMPLASALPQLTAAVELDAKVPPADQQGYWTEIQPRPAILSKNRNTRFSCFKEGPFLTRPPGSPLEAELPMISWERVMISIQQVRPFPGHRGNRIEAGCAGLESMTLQTRPVRRPIPAMRPRPALVPQPNKIRSQPAAQVEGALKTPSRAVRPFHNNIGRRRQGSVAICCGVAWQTCGDLEPNEGRLEATTLFSTEEAAGRRRCAPEQKKEFFA